VPSNEDPAYRSLSGDYLEQVPPELPGEFPDTLRI